MKQIFSVLTGLMILLALGCKPSFTISNENYQEHNFQVVSAENGYTLEMTTIYNDLYQSEILNLGGVLDTHLVRDLIDSLVLDSMMGFEASKLNLREYYNDYRIYKLRYNDYLIKQFLQKMVYDQANSDSLEIVEYYYANENLFAIEEQLDLYHIAFTENTLLNSKDSLKFRKLSDEELEIELFKFADSIKSLITAPDKFPEMAKEFSEDIVGGNKGGHLGWTKRNTYPPPFDSIAFELKNGELGGPYRDVNGIHIIMSMEYYANELLPLDEHLYKVAKKTLNTTKSNEIGNHLIDSLLSSFDVVVNDEILDKDIFVIDGKIWGAIINGIDTVDCNEAKTFELDFRNKYNVNNTSPKLKKIMFKNVGEKYVIIQAARNIDLENDSAITLYRNELKQKYARSVVARRRFDVKWTPSDSLIEEYYKSHIDQFVIEKPIKVQHIIVQDSLFGEFLRDQAMSGVDFMSLAKEHYPGEESIRNDLSDLGFIGEGDVSKEFFNVATSTRIGEVSYPVKTEFGYHIIKVLEFNKTQSISESKRIIVPILKKNYQINSVKLYMDELFSKYQVKYQGTLYPVHLKPKSLRN